MSAQRTGDKRATAAAPPEPGVANRLESELDEALEETFPASDPIAVDSAEAHKARHPTAGRND